MTGWAGQWTRKKMKCSFLDYVHFWWSAWLIDEFEPHLPLLPYQKNEMLNFRLHSTSDDQPSWSMDSNPICHPSPAEKIKCFFIGLHSTSDDWPGWVMDSNPIHHPSPAKKMKCSFLDYIQLLMIGWAGQWTRKKMKCLFLDYVHFWWSAWLIDEFEPHLPPLSSQKNEMLNFRLRSTSDDQPSWSMDSNPICHPSPANKMKCFFFGLHSTSDNWPGWVMDSNPICHPSPAKKVKCSILDYVQLLMICRAGWWTQTPSTTHLQPIKWNATFWITFNFWWLAGLVNGLKPLLHLSPAKEMKCSFLYYVQLLMISQACWWTWTPFTTPLQSKNEMLIFWLCSTSDDWPSWSMDSIPIHHPSPAKKWNAHFWITFNFWCWPDWSMDSNPIHHPSPAKKNEMLVFR